MLCFDATRLFHCPWCDPVGLHTGIRIYVETCGMGNNLTDSVFARLTNIWKKKRKGDANKLNFEIKLNLTWKACTCILMIPIISYNALFTSFSQAPYWLYADCSEQNSYGLAIGAELICIVPYDLRIAVEDPCGFNACIITCLHFLWGFIDDKQPMWGLQRGRPGPVWLHMTSEKGLQFLLVSNTLHIRKNSIQHPCGTCVATQGTLMARKCAYNHFLLSFFMPVRVLYI